MIAYYPGCSLSASAVEYGIASEALLHALKVKYREVEDWNCCGASAIHAYHENLSLAIPYRNLVQAEKIGKKLVTPCSACFSRLKAADYWFKNSPEKRDWLLEHTGLTYKGSLQVEHLAGFLLEEQVRQRVKKYLQVSCKGLKVAVYYGCLLVRPAEITEFDDPNMPTRVEALLSDIDVETVDWDYKTECCGASFSISKLDFAQELIYKILQSAKAAGADCIVTVCPLCQSNLDLRQAGVEKKNTKKFALPIYYLSELMSLAVGVPVNKLALSKHAVDAVSLLQKKALI